MNNSLANENQAGNGEIKERKSSLDYLMSLVSLAIRSLENADYENSLDLFQKAEKAFPSSTLIRYAIAVSNLYLKRYDIAINMLKEILSKDEKNPEYWTALGIAFIHKGALEEAEKSFIKANNYSKDKTETLYNLASLYYTQGKNNEAKEKFEECIKTNHAFTEAHFGLALVLEDMREYHKAIEVYEEIIRENALSEEAWFNLGVIYAYINQREKSIECYKKVVEINPSQAMAWSNMGACYAYLRDIENSIRCFQECLRIDYGSSTSWYNLGTLLCLSKSFERGIMCLEEAVRLNPLHQDALTNLANAYLETSRITEALQIYKKSLEIDPENALALKGIVNTSVRLIENRGIERAEPTIANIVADLSTAYYILNDIGVELARQNRSEDAIKFFKMSVSLKNDFASGWFNLGFTYADLKDYRNIISSYNKYLEIYGKDKHAWNNLGNAYYGIKKTKDAIECYDKALELDPRFADAMANKAHSLIDLNKFDEAIGLCKKAIEIAPNDCQGWLVYGEIMFSQEKYQEAIDCLSKAKTIDPMNLSASLFLALSFLKTSRFKEAIELLEPLSTSKDFSGLIGSAYAMMGNYEKAVRYFEDVSFERLPLSREFIGNLNYYVGLSYIINRKYEIAEEYLAKAQQVRKNDVNILSALGVVYLKRKEFEKATDVLKKALETDPRNESVLNSLSFAYWKSEAYSEMEDVLRKQSEINPQRKQTWNNLGALYLNHLYDFDKAVRAFSEAHKLSPDEPRVVLALSESLICVGDFKCAQKMILELLDKTQDPEISCLANFLVMCAAMLEGNVRVSKELLAKIFSAYEAMRFKKIKVEFSGLYKTIEHSNISDKDKTLILSTGDIIKGEIKPKTIVNLSKYLLD